MFTTRGGPPTWTRALVVSAALVALIAALCSLWIFYLNDTTVVIVLRHAEKANVPADDPPLNTAGRARAQELAHVAGVAGIDAIYATQLVRTQQTVAPLAASLGIGVIPMDRSNIDALIADIWTNHTGDVILVCAHSNTIPDIVQKLGSGPIAPIAADQFDTLFIVTITRAGRVTLVHLKYGSPSLSMQRGSPHQADTFSHTSETNGIGGSSILSQGSTSPLAQR